MRAHSIISFVVPALAASIPLADRAGPSAIHQQISPTITEYVIPRPGNFPHDPAVAADGSVWYTDQRNSYIGHLDPETGKIVDFATPDPGLGPARTHGRSRRQHLVHGPGAWTPGTGESRKPGRSRSMRFRTPRRIRTPRSFTTARSGLRTRTTIVTAISIPRPGKRWCTRCPRRMRSPTGLSPHPTAPSGSRCSARTSWVTSIRRRAGCTRSPLPAADARPRRLQVGSDGTVWYTDYGRGYLGALDPKTGKVREWKSPSPEAGPYGIAIGTDGRIWYCESRTGTMVAFDPKTEKMEIRADPNLRRHRSPHGDRQHAGQDMAGPEWDGSARQDRGGRWDGGEAEQPVRCVTQCGREGRWGREKGMRASSPFSPFHALFSWTACAPGSTICIFMQYAFWQPPPRARLLRRAGYLLLRAPPRR